MGIALMMKGATILKGNSSSVPAKVKIRRGVRLTTAGE